MPTRTTAQNGNWSSTSTWQGGTVPVNGDDVVIQAGHEVQFDVNQTGFATGLLSMQINGKLTFRNDIVTVLKMNGNITGTGELHVGTEVNPIQRPALGVQNRCQLIFNSTATINIPTIRMYGWYPDREYTQLDAAASLGTNTIVLKEDLGLQEGDVIGIGCGTVAGFLGETAKGVYSVSAYNSSTKTVTLTAALQTARLQNDYVCWVSRPIRVSRTSGTSTLLADVGISEGVVVGVDIAPTFISPAWLGTSVVSHSWTFKHCHLARGCGYVYNFIFEDCTIVNSTMGIVSDSGYCQVERCAAISAYVCFRVYDSDIKECIVQNSMYGIEGSIVKDSKVLNVDYFPFINMASFFVDCEINIPVAQTNIPLQKRGVLQKLVNCTFKANGNIGYLPFGHIELHNCLFEGTTEVVRHTRIPLGVTEKVESFDHNRVQGNYKAWIRGGKIETVDGKLKFNCESMDYPVYRDYPVILTRKHTGIYLVRATKNFSGGIVKVQLINPANDPLIDTDAEPVAERVFRDTLLSQTVKLTYRSDSTKQLILRILAQNSDGSVLIEHPRTIELRWKRRIG